jgi:pyruvate/2-oxoglutarate dehydrogenase complex dihydrolipoamide acyltransferase (E2) component
VGVAPFPPARRVVSDFLRAAGRARTIHGLVEIDVTLARRRIREWKETTGESLSLTAFLVWCVARAVEEHPAVATFRVGRRRLVAFEDVDVGVLVERTVAGEAIGSAHVVRRANRRSFREIHQEIRELQAMPVGTEPRSRRLYLRVPGPLRRAWIRWIARSPWRWKALAGTVCVTSIGMFEAGPGWGIPVSQCPLTVTVGGIGRRPALVEGRLEEREDLCLTLTLDHDVIDGAAAARFARSLRELIEGAKGLAAEPAPVKPT